MANAVALNDARATALAPVTTFNVEQVEILKLQLSLRDQRIFDLTGDLDSIFRRIGREERVELHYPDGRVLILTGVEENTESDNG